MAEQKENKTAVINSLTTLFKEMRLLDHLQIAGPTFSEKMFKGMDLDQYYAILVTTLCKLYI